MCACPVSVRGVSALVSIGARIAPLRLPSTQSGALYPVTGGAENSSPERPRQRIGCRLGGSPSSPGRRSGRAHFPELRPEALGSPWQSRVAPKPLVFSLCLLPAGLKHDASRDECPGSRPLSVPGHAGEPDQDFRITWAGEAESSPSVLGGFRVTHSPAEHLGLPVPVLEPPGASCFKMWN